MATVENPVASPPYVPFQTFKGFLEYLKGHEFPDQIDKSLMANLSGSTQGHLIGSLKFLELIDASGAPSGELKQLVQSYGTEVWPEVLGLLISNSYADIMGGLNLNTATPQQLADKFRDERAGKLEGSTADKAIRFFLSAIQEAKIPHSKRLVERKPRTGKKPRQRQAAAQQPAQEPPVRQAPPPDDRMMSIPIPFKDKPAGTISVPKDITAADCAMVKIAVQMIEAFAGVQPNNTQ